jgi:hypothetical protein
MTTVTLKMQSVPSTAHESVAQEFESKCLPGGLEEATKDLVAEAVEIEETDAEKIVEVAETEDVTGLNINHHLVVLLTSFFILQTKS